MPLKDNSKRLSFILVLIIPAIIFVLASLMKQATGPYWLGVNFDPAYLYLVNFLYIIDGIPPIFTDHPGTTLQLLGGGVIKVLSPGLSNLEIVTRVFKTPEYYLDVVHVVLLALYVFSLILLGAYAYKRSKSVLFAMFIQMSSFLMLTHQSYTTGDYILPVIANINSETLLITFINVYLIFVLKTYFDNNRSNITIALSLGAVCGLALVTKLTFMPLLLIAFILVKGWKNKAVFVFAFLVVFAITTIPIWPRYADVLRWVGGLITQKGSHGAGGKGFIDIKQYLNSLRSIVRHYLWLFVFIIGALSAVWFGVRIKKINNEEDVKRVKRARFYITLFSLSCILQYLMTAKQSGYQYMVPGVALFGLLMAILYDLGKSKMHKGFVAFGLTVMIIFFSVKALSYQRHLKVVNRDLFDFSQKIHSRYDDCIIFGVYRSSRKETALEFAEAHGIEKHYSKLLKSIYPEALFYNRWLKTFHDFDKNVMLSQVLGDKKCILMYGSTMKFLDGSITAQEIASVQSEHLYRVTHTTLDEAHRSYLMARYLAAQKQYELAIMHAIRAKKLGHPSPDGLIIQLRQQIAK